MNEILDLHQIQLSSLKTMYSREAMKTINWNQRGLMIQGARGVGKTTMMLQYIKENFGFDSKALYVPMDHIIVQNYSLYELAKFHYNRGGTHFFIDEIHKYQDWSIHLKSIYDTYTQLKCTVSGSSMLQLKKAQADLSRRYTTYKLNGFSFKEYIEIEHKIELDTYILDDILSHHVEIAYGLSSKTNILADYNRYLQFGYYPLYLEGEDYYFEKLQSILNVVLEVDIPIVTGMSIQNTQKLKKLLAIIARSAPMEPNISKLAELLELNRTTLYQYITYLEQACIIQTVMKPSVSFAALKKADKIYLHNTNIAFALTGRATNIGSIRETFFASQLKQKHQVNISPSGDFLIDEQYTFEVGGSGKSFKQIAGVENSYLAVDDLVIGSTNRIPLYLFGLL